METGVSVLKEVTKVTVTSGEYFSLFISVIRDMFAKMVPV
jgi:hypothetical protein